MSVSLIRGGRVKGNRGPRENLGSFPLLNAQGPVHVERRKRLCRARGVGPPDAEGVDFGSTSEPDFLLCALCAETAACPNGAVDGAGRAVGAAHGEG